MKSFEGRVAAVTGAGSGIGRALAERLASAGCHLALSDIDESGLAGTRERVAASGVRVTTARLDVAERDAVHAWAERVAGEHGRVDLVINNAGVALAGTVADLAIEDYEWIMGINFWGVVYGTKAFLPHLEAVGDGHVVNLSSVFGLMAQPSQSGYNASKYAVRGFTESLIQELEMTGSGVRATCVHPGGIRTNIARAARVRDSVRDLTGLDAEEAAERFERGFITSADRAAQVILDGVRARKRRVLVGPDARVIDGMVRLAPTGYQRIVTALVRRGTRARPGRA